MKTIVRLLPFILVNILVSALTTLAIIWFWEQSHGARTTIDQAMEYPTVAAGESATVQIAGDDAQEQLPPLDEEVINIENVFGVGDFENEVVVLSCIGVNDLDLSGWQLIDDNEHTYIFPEIWLSEGAQLQLYTRAGSDTALELYWGLQEPIWKTGEIVRLLDYQGNERAVYQIP